MSEQTILTTPQLIDWLKANDVGDYSRQTITYWTRLPDDPMPVHYQGKQGQSNKYDLDDVLAWMERKSQNKNWSWTATAGETDILGAEEQRVRLLRAKADQAEMQNAVTRGELTRRIDEDREAMRQARDTRLALEAIPDRIAPELAVEKDESKCHAMLLDEIRSVLLTLHKIELDRLESFNRLNNHPDKDESSS